jgi:hypothetical protein
MDIISWVMIFYSVAMTAFAVYTFGIGLSGFIRKRPLVFASRPLVWFMFTILAPAMIMIVGLSLASRKDLSLSCVGMVIFPLGMMAIMIFILWRQMSGYMIFGVSDETFREALTNALSKLNLPFQETVAKIKLTSLDADLQANVISWMGTAQIRIKQWQHARYIKEIAKAMDEYYKTNPVKVSYVAFMVHLLLGGLLVMAAFIGFSIFFASLFRF